MTDDDVLRGFGVFTGDEGEKFADGVEEAGERMDRDFRRRAERLFGDD